MRTFIFLFFFSTISFSQNAIVSAGNTINNSGSISFSVGQLVATQIVNSNAIFAPGVQHPFETLTLSLEDNISFAKAFAYPNPTKGFFNLKIDNALDFPYQLKLYDLQGRITKQTTITKNNTTVDLTSHSSGIYLLQLSKIGKQIYSFKILKN